MLARYGYYLDVKGLGGALSMVANPMIGLQAQAVGRPVFFNGEVGCGKHVLHDGSKMVERLDEVYSEIKRNM